MEEHEENLKTAIDLATVIYKRFNISGGIHCNWNEAFDMALKIMKITEIQKLKK